jgi:hypothetical protein
MRVTRFENRIRIWLTTSFRLAVAQSPKKKTYAAIYRLDISTINFSSSLLVRPRGLIRAALLVRRREQSARRHLAPSAGGLMPLCRSIFTGGMASETTVRMCELVNDIIV